MAGSGDTMDAVGRRCLVAAKQYTALGWPLFPLRPGLAVPATGGLSPGEPAPVGRWWGCGTYGIGCWTGTALDALTVPVMVGAAVLDAWRLTRPGSRPPVVEVPRSGQWTFLVQPGGVPHPALRRYQCIEAHQPWIALPPTPVLGGEVRWVSSGDPPPVPAVLQQLLVTLLGSTDTGRATPRAPTMTALPTQAYSDKDR